MWQFSGQPRRGREQVLLLFLFCMCLAQSGLDPGPQPAALTSQHMQGNHPNLPLPTSCHKSSLRHKLWGQHTPTPSFTYPLPRSLESGKSREKAGCLPSWRCCRRQKESTSGSLGTYFSETQERREVVRVPGLRISGGLSNTSSQSRLHFACGDCISDHLQLVEL